MLTVGGVFDGIGLLAYGLHLAGLEHRWLCEADPWRRSILAKRFPGVPIYADVRDVGGDAEPVHVVAGGFPCKGASTLGKLEGFGHPETVLWREMARAVGELRPRYVVVENVANILALHDGAVWGEVLGDLAALGFDVEWDVLPAAAVGAPHARPRVFAVASHPDRARADAHAAPGASRPTASERAGAAPDPDGVAGQTSVALDGRSGEMARPGALERAQRLHGEPEAAADPGGRGCEVRSQQDERSPAGESAPLGHDADGRGLRVEWGEYEPAVRRWEALAGPAPEPLLRGVDARGTRGVERSRLSALGDGVQVQLGQIVGAYVARAFEGRSAAA